MKECCVAYMNEQFGNDAELVKEIYGEYVLRETTRWRRSPSTSAARRSCMTTNSRPLASRASRSLGSCSNFN